VTQYACVIPAHNEEKRIALAIESVLAQTARPREIIVVDDGSTDGTPEVAGGFPGVEVIRCPSRHGPAHARNLGVSEATSPWIALLDADDRWDPDKMREQLTLAESSGAGLVYCGIRIVGLAQSEPLVVALTRSRSHRGLVRKLLLRNCITGSDSAVVVRKQLLDEVGGFDEQLAVGEDWDLWLRLSQRTCFAAVERPLVTLIARANSQDSDPELTFRGAQRVIEKNAALYTLFWDGALLWRKAHATLYGNRGLRYFGRHQHEQARQDLWSAIRLWPFSLRSIVPLFKLYAGIT
jgi:glycosyltransferase involved in cell wall biosynthesis